MTGILPLVSTAWMALAAAAAAQPPPGGWRDAPGYLPLFAPAGPRAAAYRIYVSPLDLPTLLARVAADPTVLRPPGAWAPAALLPADAFGQTGRYDRSKLARLYGSRRAMVARGPRGDGTRATEAWTLISPYPTREMDHLEPGTMLIVLDLEPANAP